MKSGGERLGFFLVSILIISLFLLSGALAETSRVQSTNPSDGSTNVPLDIGKFELKY